MGRVKRKYGRFPWMNTEMWEVLDAARYVWNGCPMDVAVKTLHTGKLKHRSEGAIRLRLRRVVASKK